MKMRASDHAKDRIVERNDHIGNRAQAKKVAKIAFRTGQTINQFQKYPKFFNYLSSRRKESCTCRIRIYKDNIYIWKGRSKTLITCHPIPDRFVEEINEINQKEKEADSSDKVQGK